MFPLSFQSQLSAPLVLLNEYSSWNLANTAHVSFSGVFADFFFFFGFIITSLEEANLDQGKEMAKLSDWPSEKGGLRGFTGYVAVPGGALLTSEMLIRPSWKEQVVGS